MATTTYVPIATQTLSSTASSVTFSSIPSTYTDLVLVASCRLSTAGFAAMLQFNGDTGTNYSVTELYGDGSSAASGRNSNISGAYLTNNIVIGATSSVYAPLIINIMNYSNATTYKTVLSRFSNANTGTDAIVNLWRSTSAINEIKMGLTGSGGTYAAGSTFTLYGIANAQIEAPKATGGVITYDDTYFYHTFGASGTFTPQQSLTADILVVAGGGGGGVDAGGGGGAGGLLGFASQSLTATGYTVTVGAGGTGNANGGNSQFGSLTLVTGGGKGGGFSQTAGNGGSGGGASSPGSTGASAGTGSSGQGNNGGIGSSLPAGGGGGGASSVGSNATGSAGGAGGNGLSTYSSWGLVTGTGQNVSGTIYYAGGGGGSGRTNPGTITATGAGGLGGGGKGGSYTQIAPVNGLPNTGGGGGGADFTSASNGGSGVVIIRYLKA